MILGLKIDVDTFRGTRDGVLPIVRVLDAAGVRGSFFFSLGPDNMGRHLWRLIKPAFFLKMLHSGGASLYGWDILLRGTFWPGPLMGKAFGGIIQQTAKAGHEVGLHAWDHHAWQMQMERGGADFQTAQLKLGGEALAQILGRWPDCSAAPGWKCNEATLLAKEPLAFRYNSDVRGKTPFRPVIAGRPLSQPQVPTTLPTYDEVIGRNGITNANYNAWLLDQLQPDAVNVLTIHAEVEGISCNALFRDFLNEVLRRGWHVVPLCDLLPADPTTLPLGRVMPLTQPGREGWIGAQE
ncbi:MAG: 4-deoxy-4-formamido-L-arabinose-phosphoundecaprenol deformylase [Verrucomicrobia bacterium]|nr:MAG: 4-deoxy-4-formamido-L-arabinose-phosphoundecaprenol deformylase [Verrucomicrobiota bacterium]